MRAILPNARVPVTRLATGKRRPTGIATLPGIVERGHCVFKDIGIKGRVLMLTLLPTSLLALVLGATSSGCSFPGCRRNCCNAAT